MTRLKYQLQLILYVKDYLNVVIKFAKAFIFERNSLDFLHLKKKIKLIIFLTSSKTHKQRSYILNIFFSNPEDLI